MKHSVNLRTHRSSIATLLLVSLLWAASTSAATTNAVIRTIRGTVTYKLAGEIDKEAKVGKRLAPGSSIKTQGAESQADLFLNHNGPIVRVRPDTELFIEKLDYQDTGVETVIATRLKLIKGRILGNVKKLSSDSTYEIVFPRGIVRVRGTEYDISDDGRITCISGALDVTYLRRNGRVLASCRLINGQSTECPSIQPQPSKGGYSGFRPRSKWPTEE